MLTSPTFCIARLSRPKWVRDAEIPLTDLELASRLSFFLWSQGPTKAAGYRDCRRFEQAWRTMPRCGACSPIRGHPPCQQFCDEMVEFTALDSVKPDPLFPGFMSNCERTWSPRSNYS